MNNDIHNVLRTRLDQGNTSSLKDHLICPVQITCNVKIETILLGMRTSLDQGNTISLKIVLQQSNTSSLKIINTRS